MKSKILILSIIPIVSMLLTGCGRQSARSDWNSQRSRNDLHAVWQHPWPEACPWCGRAFEGPRAYHRPMEGYCPVIVVPGPGSAQTYARGGKETEGLSRDQILRRKIMLNTSLNVFDPEAILGAKKPLKLTDDQVRKLKDITESARTNAKAILTDEQRKQLDRLNNLSNFPDSVAQMHRQWVQKPKMKQSDSTKDPNSKEDSFAQTNSIVETRYERGRRGQFRDFDRDDRDRRYYGGSHGPYLHFYYGTPYYYGYPYGYQFYYNYGYPNYYGSPYYQYPYGPYYPYYEDYESNGDYERFGDEGEGFDDDEGFGNEEFGDNNGFGNEGFGDNNGFGNEGFGDNNGFGNEGFGENESFGERGENEGFGERGFGNGRAGGEMERGGGERGEGGGRGR